MCTYNNEYSQIYVYVDLHLSIQFYLIIVHSHNLCSNIAWKTQNNLDTWGRKLLGQPFSAFVFSQNSWSNLNFHPGMIILSESKSALSLYSDFGVQFLDPGLYCFGILSPSALLQRPMILFYHLFYFLFVVQIPISVVSYLLNPLLHMRVEFITTQKIQMY